jgi:hypothetical protein
MTTVHVRLSPLPEQAALLRAHCQEDSSTITVLTPAQDGGVLPDDGEGASTQAFTAALPSAVKHQASRDAHSVWKRACALGRLPVLHQPICQWNNQHWRIEGNTLLPLHQDSQVRQARVRCAPLAQEGMPGLLRIKRKRGKWIAEIAFTLPTPEPTPEQGIMAWTWG